MSYKTYVLEGSIVAEQPLATCSKDLLDRKGRKNQPVPVPSTMTPQGERLMFPATGLRGGFRRACRDVVRHHVIKQTGDETPFNLDTHLMLTLGGIKGSGEEDKTAINRIADLREKNPLINIFGAGDAGTMGFVSGRLGVGNAICNEDLAPVVFSGARTDDIFRDPDQVQFLSEADLVMLNEMSQGNRELSRMKGEATKLKRHYAESKANGDAEASEKATQQLNALEEEMTKVRESSGSQNSIGMPLAGWQAIPQGAVMKQRMVLRRASQVDLGLLLATLNAFGLEPIIGAHYAAGNGLVSASWDVSEVTLEGKKPVGRVSFAPFEPAQMDGPELVEATQAFTAFMEAGEWDFNTPEKV